MEPEGHSRTEKAGAALTLVAALLLAAIAVDILWPRRPGPAAGAPAEVASGD